MKGLLAGTLVLLIAFHIGCGRDSPMPSGDPEETPRPASYSATTQEFLATPSDDLESIRALLEEGADVNAFDEDGRTMLWRAAWDANVELTEMLLNHGADPNTRDKTGGLFGGGTALHVLGLERAPVPETYKEDSVAIAELLIGNGADVNAQNSVGVTPLDGAASTRMDELVNLLQKHGAEPNCDPDRNPKLSNSLCRDE